MSFLTKWFTQSLRHLPQLIGAVGFEPTSHPSVLFFPNWHYTPNEVLAINLNERVATNFSGFHIITESNRNHQIPLYRFLLLHCWTKFKIKLRLKPIKNLTLFFLFKSLRTPTSGACRTRTYDLLVNTELRFELKFSTIVDIIPFISFCHSQALYLLS